MPVVIVPPPFQGPTLGESRVQVTAPTVRRAIEAIEARYPGFGAQVFTGDGSLQSFAQIFRNGDPVSEEGLDQVVEARDEIEVVAAIAGG